MNGDPSGISSFVIITSLVELILVIGGAYLYFKLHRLRKKHEMLVQERDVIFGFIHDVGEVFAESEYIEPDLLLKRVLFYALRTTRAAAGAVYLYDRGDDALRARAISGVFPPLTERIDQTLEAAVSKSKHIENLVKSRTIRRGEGLVGVVADLGTPILIEDAELDPRVPIHKVDYLKLHSLLLVPMRFHQQTLGVLVVVNSIDGKPFVDADMNLLQALADQASASIHYTGLRETLDEKKQIDHDLTVARKIQLSLLPKEVPHIPGFELAAFNDPAKEIGGDYYDFIQIDKNHLGIAVADVSGKGISGAILMSVCRSVLRAQAAGNLSPAAVLKSLNSVMSVDIAEDMFVSVLYMVVHLDSRRVDIARAGHEGPIRVAKDGQISLVESKGPAIGMVNSGVFNGLIQEISIELNPGDVVVAYTDGITEAMNAEGEEWGLHNLMESARISASEGAHSVVSNIQQRLNRFVGDHPQYDDMTLLALRVIG